MAPYRVLWAAIALSLGVASCAAPARPTAERAAPAPPVRVSGSGTVLPIVKKLAERYSREHPAVRFEIEEGTNSGGAIKGVLQGTLQLGVVNRPLTDAESKQPLEYHAFARDAVVVAANLSTTPAGLTSNQVRAIYAGRLLDWWQVGGLPGPILVFDRDDDESMRKLVLLKLMGETPVGAPTVVLTTSRDMLQALAATPNSVGYLSLGNLRIHELAGVSALSLDGVKPSLASVVSGEYPWHLTFGLVHGVEASPVVRDFVAFALGPGGRQALEEWDVAPPAK